MHTRHRVLSLYPLVNRRNADDAKRVEQKPPGLRWTIDHG